MVISELRPINKREGLSHMGVRGGEERLVVCGVGMSPRNSYASGLGALTAPL